MDMEYLSFDALLSTTLNTKWQSVKTIFAAPGKLDFKFLQPGCPEERIKPRGFGAFPFLKLLFLEQGCPFRYI
jgi:hypothetical protein